MRPLLLLGAAIAAFGIVALVMSGGVRYSRREALPHNAATQVTLKQEKILVISPLVAGATLAAGVALMIVASRK